MNHYNARFKHPTPKPLITNNPANSDVITYTVDEATRLGWIEKYGPIIRPLRKRA